jgi:hypothetical protein
MHIFSQFDIRPEWLKISLIGNFSHESSHLHAGFLAIGVTFPIMPVESTLDDLNFTCLFNKVFKPLVIKLVTAMEIGE